MQQIVRLPQTGIAAVQAPELPLCQLVRKL